MRLFLSIVLVGIVCTSIVTGEQCTVNEDCTQTQCTAANTTVVCQHPEDSGIVTNGGLCTCQDSGNSGECVNKEECYGTGSSLTCPDDSRHCYDNRCICDRFPIGRR